jgi:hypothetical protein
MLQQDLEIESVGVAVDGGGQFHRIRLLFWEDEGLFDPYFGIARLDPGVLKRHIWIFYIGVHASGVLL